LPILLHYQLCGEQWCNVLCSTGLSAESSPATRGVRKTGSSGTSYFINCRGLSNSFRQEGKKRLPECLIDLCGSPPTHSGETWSISLVWLMQFEKGHQFTKQSASANNFMDAGKKKVAQHDIMQEYV